MEMNNRELGLRVQKLFLSELSDKYIYHGWEHTCDVLMACRLHLKVNPDLLLFSSELEAAALLHDTGIVRGMDGHEEKSVSIAHEWLPALGFSSRQVELVTSLILSTRMPQNPKTLLECIICDADLDYLGTDKYEILSNRLFLELSGLGDVQDLSSWRTLQIQFLQQHRYHTQFAQLHRQPVMEKHLENLLLKL